MSKVSYVRLIWQDPVSGDLNQPLLTPPICIGRDKEQMPKHLGNYTVSPLELVHKQVSRFHALITVANEQMYITDKSSNGTYFNGRLLSQKNSQLLSNKDTIRIGPYKITATLVTDKDINSTEINRDFVNISGEVPPVIKYKIFLWIAGVLVGILLSLGFGILIKNTLEKLRPQPSNNYSEINQRFSLKTNN